MNRRDKFMSRRALREQLGLTERQVRYLVAVGWLAPTPLGFVIDEVNWYVTASTRDEEYWRPFVLGTPFEMPPKDERKRRWREAWG